MTPGREDCSGKELAASLEFSPEKFNGQRSLRAIYSP